MSLKHRVLFVCTNNSARSQMAEGLLHHLHGDSYEVESAETEPAEVNPLAARCLSPQEKLFQLRKQTLSHEAQGDPRRGRGRGVHRQLSGTSWLPFSRRYRRRGPGEYQGGDRGLSRISLGGEDEFSNHPGKDH